MNFTFQPKNMEELLKRHELLKSKGLKLTADDLFQRNTLLEAILDLRTNKRSERLESRNQLENEKAGRRLMLKEEKTDDWKKKHTENTMDCLIAQEFQEKDQSLSLLKTTIELLENKVAVIPEYIQIGKRFLPTNY